ncbi:hypothetical protein AALB39_15095 [Lachnospiraceae bacterium 54-53]
MKSSEKKVIVFIVEGPSDEAAIGPVIKEFFSKEQVQFLVVHGDITSRDYVSTENVLSKINGLLEFVKEKYRYKTTDFFKIIHLTDTDGVFVPDQYIRTADVPSITYHVDHVDTKSVESTLRRNHQKADILFKLRKTGEIKKIPYRIYYNSCNLEHVLYKELKDFTNEEKEEMADAFAERYENHVEDFISFISDGTAAVPGTYQETWKYIEKDLNSLNRNTNIHQIFVRESENTES